MRPNLPNTYFGRLIQGVTRGGSRYPSLPGTADAQIIIGKLPDPAILNFADAVVASDVPTISLSKAQADTVTAADAATRQATRSQADAVVVADAKTISVIRSIADAVAVVDATTRQVARLVADAVATVDAATRKVTRARSDAATASDLAQISEAEALAVSDTVTVVDNVSRRVTLALADSVAVSDAAQVQSVVPGPPPDSGPPPDYSPVVPYGPAPFPSQQIRINQNRRSHLTLSFADEMIVSDEAQVKTVRDTPLYVSDIINTPIAPVEAATNESDHHQKVIDLLVAGVI